MEALPLAFTTGWASGINAYACVLILGLLGRFADVDSVPKGLTGNGVLIAAAALFAFEFVADKIPYVDSAWDAISTPAAQVDRCTCPASASSARFPAAVSPRCRAIVARRMSWTT